MDRPWLALYPPGSAPDIDPRGLSSVIQLFKSAAVRHPDRVAVSCLGSDLSYRELEAASRALAAWFASLGLPRGARVALMMPSTPAYLACQLALMRVGLVAVNVNPLYTPRELAHQLRDSGAETIVVLENFAATVEAVREKVPLRQIVVATLGDLLGPLRGRLVNLVARHLKKVVPPWSLPGHLRLSDVLARGRSLPFNDHVPAADDLAMLQYTGGTTGLSKGAMLLHRNLLAASLQATEWLRVLMRVPPAVDEPTLLVPLPLYHVFTIYMVMMAMSQGARVVLVPNPRDVDSLVETMRRTRFHHMMGLDTLYRALADHPRIGQVDFSHCRGYVAGGTATRQAVAERWHALTGHWITEGWGMSETTGGGTCNPPHLDRFDGTIGVPLPSTRISIRDEAGRDLPVGQPGEICITGPQVMSGYWQQPEATAEAFWPGGWLRTGDVGLFEADGRVRIVDRMKDMALVSGFNVYPSEIESVVTQHPGVLEAAAVGVPDGDSGEAIRLFVVKRSPALDEAMLRAHCAEHLTNYKRPKQIVFLDALPKSPVGKVLRRELKGR
ncbi:MAG: long-chain fatty acid--CoA ligase [Burkholderiaceae bacterium]|nr:MAG: long-chain fatty acid--CoA ligase [Burkholderiaceae bacterium]